MNQFLRIVGFLHHPAKITFADFQKVVKMCSNQMVIGMCIQKNRAYGLPVLKFNSEVSKFLMLEILNEN